MLECRVYEPTEAGGSTRYKGESIAQIEVRSATARCLIGPEDLSKSHNLNNVVLATMTSVEPGGNSNEEPARGSFVPTRLLHELFGA